MRVNILCVRLNVNMNPGEKVVGDGYEGEGIKRLFSALFVSYFGLEYQETCVNRSEL